MCSWGEITHKWEPGTKTLTITVPAGESLDNLNDEQINALVEDPARGELNTLVLVGNISNHDFTAEGKLQTILERCYKKLKPTGEVEKEKRFHIDLSACTNIESKYVYTGTLPVDWTTNNFKFVPESAITHNVTKKITEAYQWTINGAAINDPDFLNNVNSNSPDYTKTYSFSLYGSEGTIKHVANGTEISTGHYCNNGDGWYWDGNDYCAGPAQKSNDPVVTTTYTYVDDNGNTITLQEYQLDKENEQLVFDGTYYKYTEHPVTLTFTKIKEYINGVTFPCSNKFTAIPESLCLGFTDLTTVSFGNNSQVQWIGANAFNGCTSLKYFNGNTTAGKVTFPQSICGIGIDAFYKCLEFVEVDLSNLQNLVRVDAAAFNMESTSNGNKLRTVKLPESENNTLKFFANQVFTSTQVTDLDFSHCKGIYHFAYDGADYFDEGTYTGSTTSSTMTFAYHEKLQNIILPPNILLIAKNCFDKCGDLHSVTFTGSANYNNQCELPDNNRLVIDDNAFKDCTKLGGVIVKDDGTEDVGFVILSNNLVRIGKRAFDQTALRSISIPASVEIIEQMAFNENDDLTTVIFEDIDPNCQCGDDPTKKPSGYATVIKGGSIQYDEDGNPTTDPNNQEQGAFWNCKAITDVYINNQTQLQCENLAFVFDVTYGHANANASLATLHFPEKDTDHYANLDHYLTDQIAANSGLFHKWLHEHFRQAIVPKHNGWYEFVNSGPTNNIDNPDDVCQSIILRTFSDWSHSYLVPEGIRAYIVNKIEKNGDNYEVTLRRLLSIPARTGVILYGHPNGKNTKGEPILTMTPISFAKKGQNIMVYDEDGNGTLTEATNDQGLPLSRAYWGNLSTTKTKKKPISDYDMYKNYLEPTCTPTEADHQLLQNRITSLTTKIAKLEEGGITAEEQNDYKDYKAQKTAAERDLAEIETLWNKHAQDWKKDGEFWGGRYLKPFENVDDDPMNVNTAADVKYRNFGMGRYNSTISSFRAVALEGNEDNYMAFFRLMKGYYPDGKAYLQLENSENEYAEARGAEILVKKDEGDYDEYVVVDDNGEVVIENGQPKKATSPKDSYFVEYSKNDGSKMDMRADGTSNPHGWWVKNKGFDWDIYDEDGSTYDGPRKNWGKRPTRFGASPELAPVYLGEFEEDTDGIVKLVIPAEQEKVDGHFYNLQGVKVNNPVKGIYIHNGKKVTIK